MGTFINPRISTANLICYLDAGNSISANGGIGTMWFDRTANSDIMGLNIGPTYTQMGGSGNWFNYFNNDYTEILGSDGWNLNNNFTVEIVFFFQHDLNAEVPLIEKYTTGVGNGGWKLRANNTINNGDPGIGWYSVNNTSEDYNWTTLSSDRALTPNTWYIVQAVCDGGPTTPNMRIIINGVQPGAAGGPLTETIGDNDGVTIKIARDGNGGSVYSNIGVNMVRIYDRALSNTEMRNNYISLRNRFDSSKYPWQNNIPDWSS